MGSPRLIRLPDVVARVSLNQPQIWFWMKNGSFPPARYLGRGIIAWLEDDITAWIEGRRSWTPTCWDNRQHPIELDTLVVAVAPLCLTKPEALTYTGLADKAFAEFERDGSIVGRNVGPRGRKIYLRRQLDAVVGCLFDPLDSANDWFGSDE
jgi:predicted DNA-binding transcriptional regulator AlpA